jgi:hypothetical protein
MRSRALHYAFAASFLIIVPCMLFGVACGDDEEWGCVDVACDNHVVGSKKFYQTCCANTDEGRECAYVTGDGTRYDCNDLNCPELVQPIAEWCAE